LLEAAGYEVAVEAAKLSSLFPSTQIWLTLLIGPTTKAAVVKAIKANSRVYSVRSCPSSSRNSRFSIDMRSPLTSLTINITATVRKKLPRKRLTKLDIGRQWEYPRLRGAVGETMWRHGDAPPVLFSNRRLPSMRLRTSLGVGFLGMATWGFPQESIRKVFPGRPLVELSNSDPIFHTVYDLHERFQMPGAQYFDTHKTYEQDGYQARWRAIYDDRGRVMMAICREWSDDERSYEKRASLAYRIAVNHFVYDLTH